MPIACLNQSAAPIITQAAWSELQTKQKVENEPPNKNQGQGISAHLLWALERLIHKHKALRKHKALSKDPRSQLAQAQLPAQQHAHVTQCMQTVSSAGAEKEQNKIHHCIKSIPWVFSHALPCTARTRVVSVHLQAPRNQCRSTAATARLMVRSKCTRRWYV
jgi:hypothetical protein